MHKFMKIILVLLITWLVWANVVSAGECLNVPRDLAGYFDSADLVEDKQVVQYYLFCISYGLWMIHRDHKMFKIDFITNYSRNDSLNKRMQKSLLRILESGDSSYACPTIKALARYKWPNCFEYLKNCVEDRDVITLYALNEIKEATPIIIARYKRFDKRYKAKPLDGLHDKLICLGALYQLGTHDNIPFLDSLIEEKSMPVIKRKARLVKDRIFEKYPDHNEILNKE